MAGVRRRFGKLTLELNLEPIFAVVRMAVEALVEFIEHCRRPNGRVSKWTDLQEGTGHATRPPRRASRLNSDDRGYIAASLCSDRRSWCMLRDRNHRSAIRNGAPAQLAERSEARLVAHTSQQRPDGPPPHLPTGAQRPATRG